MNNFFLSMYDQLTIRIISLLGVIKKLIKSIKVLNEQLS
jgi:hypothetical protein